MHAVVPMTVAPLTRRKWLQHSGAAAISTTGLTAAWSQTTPGNMDSAKIVVGSPAGAILDAFARRIADAVSPGFARNVIVENRVGASGQIATAFVRNAAPDGSTILLTPMPMMALFPHTYKRLPYDPVEDFTPVSLGATSTLALGVGPMVPASVKTVAEFVTWCKANPAQSSFGSPAAGSTPHFAGIILGKAAGFDFVHVPFRGTAPAINDMMGSQIAAVVSPVGDFLPHLESGRARLLAVASSRRSRFVPSVPTFLELGYKDVVTSDWFAFFVPSKTPAPQLQKLSSVLKTALNAPEVTKAMELRGLETVWSTPAELGERLKADIAHWGGVVKGLGFTAES